MYPFSHTVTSLCVCVVRIPDIYSPSKCQVYSVLLLLLLLLLLGFLGLHSQHMELLRLGVKSELQLLAYARATATLDLSRVCDLHHSSWQHWILNPLSKARDRTHVLMDPS